MGADLESTLADIVSRLKEGRYANEQAVSQGIVLRVLDKLAWPTWDTDAVHPEYQTGEGRADFALCDPTGRPAVFIEVKAPGHAEDGIRQALDYAFHTGGVQLVVLTDGKTWSFYLTMEPGTYEDRRVYKLDLFERSPAEAAAKIYEYLARDRVQSGQAVESARDEYRSRHRASRAREAIPNAWQELIEERNQDLVDLVAREAESKSGFRPTDTDVMAFLSSLTRSGFVQSSPVRPAHGRAQAAALRSSQPTNVLASGRRKLLILGQEFEFSSAQNAMAIVLRELAQLDPTFLQRFSQHPGNQRLKRRLIARATEELYPDRPDLRRYHEKLPDGWVVETNMDNSQKMKVIRLATQVAGLTFGQDVEVEF